MSVLFSEIISEKSLLFFWAEWHEPSKGMKQVVEAIQVKYPSIAVQSIEAEEHADVSTKYDVTVVPTFIALLHGNVFERVEGVNHANVAAMVKRLSEQHTTHAASTNSANHKGVTADKTSATMGTHVSTETSSVISSEMKERLRKLIFSHTTMLFMKGTPDAPRCGFSKQIIEILSNNNIAFGSFDILSDEEVRQLLKVYSEWPTYPQLYVNGELIGGLDIIKEMVTLPTPLKTQLNIIDIPIQEVHSKPSLEDRIRGLISSAEVMLFMKGSPTEPKCGFSRRTVEILNSHNILFSSFDILLDEDIRQGIKILMEWPTFPQLYVRGELVGGLDILQEMEAKGSLQTQFDAVNPANKASLDHDHAHSHSHDESCGHTH